jgi:23S rRNA (guanosine2251-2'-O)-methyltransferase
VMPSGSRSVGSSWMIGKLILRLPVLEPSQKASAQNVIGRNAVPDGGGLVKSMQELSEDLVYGQHAVTVLLNNGADRITEIWLQEGRDTKLSKSLQGKFSDGSVPIHMFPKKKLDSLFEGARHQGVVVRARPGKRTTFETLLDSIGPQSLVVLLDGVEDPHNLGAVLRSSDGAGVDAVIIPRSRGTSLTPIVQKVASGAAESVPLIEVANLSRAMQELSEAGVHLVGTDLAAETSLFEADLDGPVGLVFGAEGSGLRRLTKEHCAQLIYLPMRGQVQSLNISVAAGICLFEVVRRRLID